MALMEEHILKIVFDNSWNHWNGIKIYKIAGQFISKTFVLMNKEVLIKHFEITLRLHVINLWQWSNIFFKKGLQIYYISTIKLSEGSSCNRSFFQLLNVFAVY